MTKIPVSTVSRKAASSVRTFCTLVLLTALALPGLLASRTADAADAAEITLSWVAPSTDVYGAPITDLAGYMLYSGNAPGSYQQSVDIGNLTKYTLANLSEGSTYYFAVTAYDSSRQESDYSDEVSKSFPAALGPPVVTVPIGSGEIITPIDDTAAAIGQTTPDGMFTASFGKIVPDLTDALRATLIFAGEIVPTAADLAHGDIAPLDAAGKPFGDGRIDVYDVIGILRMSVGLL